MSKPQAVPLPVIILITLLLQLATPGIAWAEGEAPPAEPEPATEVSDEPAPTIAEVVDAAPAGTEVLVVDAAGAPEPLASAEAAQAISESDPIWCPGAAGPADPSCTPSQTTVDDLLLFLDGNKATYLGAGTIYFTTNYAVDDAYFTGSDSRLSALTALTINGQASAGYTVAVPIEVTGWSYDVGIIDLNMVGAAGALRVETTGAITITDVTITASGGDGAYLDNTSGAGSITIVDSTFSDNTWTGLDARSHGDITLTDVVATGQEAGAYLDASGGPGTVTVDGTAPGDSDFSGNTLAGLTAKAAEGGVAITNVTANANLAADAYGIGVTAKNGGPTSVTTSEASHNLRKGLWIEGTGPILLEDVSTDTNGADGAYLHNLGACAAAPIAVSIDGGTYTNNGGFGLRADLGPAGALTFLSPPTFGGNASGDYAVNLDPCPECEHEKEEGKPYSIVEVPETGTPPTPLDCGQFAGTVFLFPTGDRAILTCPVGGEATVSPVPVAGMPAPLPVGRSFINGASVILSAGGQPRLVLDEGGYLTVVLQIPDQLKGSSLAILYWDTSTGAWVELPAYSTRPDGSPIVHRLHPNVTPDDLMYILGGVRVVGDSVKVKVTFGGIFVLASR